ncbi:MAG: hypothetical protein HC938_11615 [Nitrospira sp.]|nr:hypothetical protein [Nitrospira sp.]
MNIMDLALVQYQLPSLTQSFVFFYSVIRRASIHPAFSRQLIVKAPPAVSLLGVLALVLSSDHDDLVDALRAPASSSMARLGAAIRL